ncbi:hypothetical protein [Streptomyces sp. NPDC091416]|uniref:hypothetical protein n=1 Tax=Streptomyces sp. NPDC091416 TaxID=3366003 RepID=UPI00381A4B0E
MTSHLPARSGPMQQSVPADGEQRERLYLALLDLAPEFRIPCRPSGALRDLTVSRHRNGPNSPWQWALHRLGAGLTTFAWDDSGWIVVDDRAHMLEHAVWAHPVEAIFEAQRIAQADEDRGHTEVERINE